MAPKATSGSGRAQGRPSRPNKGGPSSVGVGRYTPPERSGRYTAPIPRKVRRSGRWYGPTILFLFIFAILMILLNYLTVLPGSASTWYLVSGIVVIAVAFGMATRYR
jgi:cell division protein CrgA